MAWVILHREETVAFGSMPLVTRGIAAELLKVCDIATGALVCSSGDWQGAICMRLGAHPRERKAVRSALDQLMSSGYLCYKSGVIWITNFEAYQSKKAKKGATHPAPNVDGSSTDGSRMVDGSSTDGSRMVVVTSTDDAPNDRPNASESFGFGKNNTYIQTDKQADKQTEKQGAQETPKRDPGFSAGRRTELTPAADAFWAELPAWPRNRSTRREFEKAWRKERCEAIASEIMLALADWKKSADWTRDGGEYIPAAHRLIARRFWESRPQVPASRDGQAPRRPSWRDDDSPILADLSLKFDPEAVP